MQLFMNNNFRIKIIVSETYFISLFLQTHKPVKALCYECETL